MTQNTIRIKPAVLDDCAVLAVMNRQLIDDEGNGNTMTAAELENRMSDWLERGVYTAYLFTLRDEIIGYALVDISDTWMRHFFICREHRRKGYGRTVVALLLEYLGFDEIGLSCLTKNAAGRAFWQSFSHEAYSIKYNIRRD